MGLPPQQPAPRYVVCRCQFCDGHIEFDANELAEENCLIPCPHCGLETKLFVPHKINVPAGAVPPQVKPSPAEPPPAPLPRLTEKEINSVGERQNDAIAAKLYAEGDQNVILNFDEARRYIQDPRLKLMNPETGERFTPETLEIFIRPKQASRAEHHAQISQAHIDYLTSIGVPDADKLNDPNHPWNHQSASPKQVAYLTYMGVANAAQLTKKQASDMIDSNPFLDGANSLSAFDRISSRQNRWHEERLKLYPDLYAFELKDYLRDDLPRSLHAYVRRQMVGASDNLTKPMIRQVVDELTGEDPRWWHQSNYQAVFFERLRQIFPRCCDGRLPDSQM